MFIHVPRQTESNFPECPQGTRLCDIRNGAFCFNSTNGGVCCEDGSGQSSRSP